MTVNFTQGKTQKMTSQKNFCHLHVHTEYSILDGANRIKDLVSRVADLGMGACAITDHGVLSGVIEFYKECKKQGIKPILGCEVYITEDPDDLTKQEMTRDNRHMVLLAMNNTGWKNLVWLTNRAHMHNFYYKPRISIEHLKERNEGLIATSACLGGVIAKKARPDQGIMGMERDPVTKTISDPNGTARAWMHELADIFPGRFYLEVQPQDMWEQQVYNQWLIQGLDDGTSWNLPHVLTTDAHYLTENDRATHSLLMAQQLKKTLAEYECGGDMQYTGGKFHIRTPEELLKEAIDMGVESAFCNTMEIADRCDVELTLGEYQTPLFDVKKVDDYQDFIRWKRMNSAINE